MALHDLSSGLDLTIEKRWEKWTKTARHYLRLDARYSCDRALISPCCIQFDIVSRELLMNLPFHALRWRTDKES